MLSLPFIAQKRCITIHSMMTKLIWMAIVNEVVKTEGVLHILHANKRDAARFSLQIHFPQFLFSKQQFKWKYLTFNEFRSKNFEASFTSKLLAYIQMPIRSTYMSLGNYLHWVAICDRLEHLVSQGHARFATRKCVNLMNACQCLNAPVPIWFQFLSVQTGSSTSASVSNETGAIIGVVLAVIFVATAAIVFYAIIKRRKYKYRGQFMSKLAPPENNVAVSDMNVWMP